MTDAAEPPTPPPACGVAFKEWAGVCRALSTGRQALILRKGGIEEGPGGFAPEHAAFWLYPTRVHQGQQGLKPDATAPEDDDDPAAGGSVALEALAVVGLIALLDDPAKLDALDGLHVWTRETVEKRYQYRRPGLWVLGVRVFRSEKPERLTVTAEHAGCKTWVPLDPPVSTAGLDPVLGPGEFRSRMDRLRDALGATP